MTVDEPNTPTLGSAFARAMEARLSELNVAIPARVESYDEGKGMISAQPLIMEAKLDESGDRVAVRQEIIHGIPIMLPGSGGVRVRFPINVGDTVLLVFASRSLDRWLVRGGEVDPEDDRRHSRNDAIAYPNLQSFNAARDAASLIDFKQDGSIEIGSGVMTVLDGVVTGQGTDPYTGLKYGVLGSAIATVKAK